MDRTIFQVEPSGKEWVLRQLGSDFERRFPTRDQAVESGRVACKANLPSRLQVRSKPS